MNSGLSRLALITVSDVRVALLPGTAFGQTGGAGVEIEHLADAGVDGAGKGDAVAEHGVFAGHPPFQVGQVAIGGGVFLAGDAVVPVPRNHPPRRCRGRMSAYIRSPGCRRWSPISSPAAWASSMLGMTPMASTASSQGSSVPFSSLTACQLAVLAEKSGQLHIGDDIGGLAAHVVLQHLGHFPVQEHQDLGQHFDDGDVDAGQLQRLAGFDADQSAADYHRFLYGSLVADAPQKVGVAHGLEGCHPFQVDTGHRRFARLGAGGDDQLVVGEITTAPLFRSRQRTFRPARSMAVTSVSVRASYPLGVHKEVRVAHLAVGGAEQGIAVVEHTADKVRIAAGCHGHLRRFLDNGDLGIRVEALGPRRRLGAGRRASDNHDTFILCHDNSPCKGMRFVRCTLFMLSFSNRI